MNKLAFAASVVFALGVGSPAQAATFTLDFANACVGPCVNGALISQSYGDVAGIVDVQYSSSGGTVNWWNGSDYALSAPGVAYTDQGGALSITFLPLNGSPISLLRFDFGVYAGRSTTTQFSIHSIDNSVNYNSGGTFPMGPPNASSLSFDLSSNGLTSTSGIILSFGPDAWNTGITNVSFSVDSVVAVPGPVAGAGLIPLLGIGGAWLVRRRKWLAA